MMRPAPLRALFLRDFTLAFRQGGGAGVSLGFFVLTGATAPLAIGSDAANLAPIAAGVLWIAAALSALLSLERMFQADADDGALEGLALGPAPLELVALSKMAAFWVSACAPAALAAPIVSILLQAPAGEHISLMIALLIGTPAFALIGGAAAALSVGVRRGGLLISLLALPLFAPALIFGSAAAHAGVQDGFASEPMLFLAAFTLFCLATCPFAAGAALRLNLE